MEQQNNEFSKEQILQAELQNKENMINELSKDLGELHKEKAHLKTMIGSLQIYMKSLQEENAGLKKDLEHRDQKKDQVTPPVANNVKHQPKNQDKSTKLKEGEIKR